MKYTYEGKDMKDIIDNYIIDGDNIVVTYLDKSIKKYNKDKEQEIINEMIKQAIERTKLGDNNIMNNLERHTFGIEYSIIGIIGLICFCLIDINNNKEFPNKIHIITLAGLVSSLSYNVIFSKYNYKILKDYEKYRIWVKNYNMGNKICDINELDKLTLKKINKQIETK